MIKTKKITLGLIALICILCLVGTVAAIPTYNQTRQIPQQFIKPLPSNSSFAISLSKQTDLATMQGKIIASKNPYYYAETDFASAPYVRATQVEKRSVWFKYIAGYWAIDWDQERKPFDLVIIHHSDGPANVTIAEINAGCKEVLYVKRYNSGDTDPYVKGLSPHSGHMVNGAESFLPYHYIVYPDGKVVYGLKSLVMKNGVWYVDQVGWHVGNWDANCRSVSILLMGDYDNGTPPAQQLATTKEIVSSLKHFNRNLKIAPHYAYNSQSNCPGFNFQQWQYKII